MNVNDIKWASMKKILQEIEEGIQIIDKNGKTIVYNDAMEKIEGLNKDKVIGKHLLDLFPNWTIEKSTLLTVLQTGKPIKREKQDYINFKGNSITTTNNTFPITMEGEVIGAVEIAKNLTNVNEMSNQIIDLQQKLIKPQKNKKQNIKKYTFDGLIGRDKQFLKSIGFAEKAAKSTSSILITGETGTGKELFAQSIHYGSRRKDQPFIAQNCAALPENLLEGILFGTSKGGFTGAVDRPGLFEQADRGTLFLDEINSMDLNLQAKLLRVLQEKYIRRVGGKKDMPVDVRIIASSNQQPKELLESGFRKDLFYRINVMNVQIPALRDRREDINLLAKHFIEEYNQSLQKDVWMLSKEVLKAFNDYSWDGNVRELRNFIETAMNLVAHEHVIAMEHFPPYYEELLKRKKTRLRKVKLLEDEGLNDYIEKIEKNIIQRKLEDHGYNITKTAKDLQISRQNLQYKLKKYGIKI